MNLDGSFRISGCPSADAHRNGAEHEHGQNYLRLLRSSVCRTSSRFARHAHGAAGPGQGSLFVRVQQGLAEAESRSAQTVQKIGAQQHQLAAVAVAEPPPERIGDAEGQHPEEIERLIVDTEFRLVLDLEALLHVVHDERQDEGVSAVGDDLPQPDDAKISFPVDFRGLPARGGRSKIAHETVRTVDASAPVARITCSYLII